MQLDMMFRQMAICRWVYMIKQKGFGRKMRCLYSRSFWQVHVEVKIVITQGSIRSQGCTTKQESQAFFALAGSTNPTVSIRDNGYRGGGYQLALLTQAFFLRVPIKQIK